MQSRFERLTIESPGFAGGWLLDGRRNLKTLPVANKPLKIA